MSQSLFFPNLSSYRGGQAQHAKGSCPARTNILLLLPILLVPSQVTLIPRVFPARSCWGDKSGFKTHLPMVQQQSCSTLMEAKLLRVYKNCLEPLASTPRGMGTTILESAPEPVKGFSLTWCKPASSAMRVITNRLGRNVRITLEIKDL